MASSHNQVANVRYQCFVAGRAQRVSGVSIPVRADLYAAKHSIEGLLREDLLNLNAQNRTELQLLRTTPAAGVGTCLYKAEPDQEEDLQRIVEVLGAHDIGAFFPRLSA